MKKLLGIRTPDKLSPEKQGAQQRSASPTPRLPAAVTQSASSAANSAREARGAADETAPQCSLGLLVLRRVDEALALGVGGSELALEALEAELSELWRFCDSCAAANETAARGAGPLVAGKTERRKVADAYDAAQRKPRASRPHAQHARRSSGDKRAKHRHHSEGTARSAAPTPVQAAWRGRRVRTAQIKVARVTEKTEVKNFPTPVQAAYRGHSQRKKLSESRSSAWFGGQQSPTRSSSAEAGAATGAAGAAVARPQFMTDNVEAAQAARVLQKRVRLFARTKDTSADPAGAAGGDRGGGDGDTAAAKAAAPSAPKPLEVVSELANASMSLAKRFEQATSARGHALVWRAARDALDDRWAATRARHETLAAERARAAVMAAAAPPQGSPRAVAASAACGRGRKLVRSLAVPPSPRDVGAVHEASRAFRAERKRAERQKAPAPHDHVPDAARAVDLPSDPPEAGSAELGGANATPAWLIAAVSASSPSFAECRLPRELEAPAWWPNDMV